MKTSLIAALLLGLTLPLGCTVEEDSPPDPLGKPAGFCQAFAESACQPKVVEYCNAKSTEACVATQIDFCLNIVPANYSSAHAESCLNAVKDAYSDGDLSPEELAVVLNLAAPCDQLSKGTRSSGQSCSNNDECNTADGFSCIQKLGAAEGICGEAELIAAGEACDSPNQVCKEGYYCNGETCGVYKRTGNSCDGDYQCKPTDRCLKEAEAETGTCELRADLNDPCTQNSDCQSGYCAPGETENTCASTIRLSRTEPLCDNLR
jgi:hypothetical protein